MNLSNLKSKIGGALLAFSILFGVGAAMSATTHAQWQNDRTRRDREYEREQRRREREWQREQRRREREERRNDGYNRNDPYYNDDRDRNDDYYGRRDNGPNWGGSYDLRQTAMNAGYNNGIEEGRKDRQRGDRFDFRDENEYQKATKDYNSRFGSRDLYQRYFRYGFQNGYRDGYEGN